MHPQAAERSEWSGQKLGQIAGVCEDAVDDLHALREVLHPQFFTIQWQTGRVSRWAER